MNETTDEGEGGDGLSMSKDGWLIRMMKITGS